MIHIVDHKDDNYLFRGNLPLKDHKFQFDELRETLLNKTEDKKADKSKYKIVVVNLLNSLTPK